MKNAKDLLNAAYGNIQSIETLLTEAHAKAENNINKDHITEAMDYLQNVKRSIDEYKD